MKENQEAKRIIIKKEEETKKYQQKIQNVSTQIKSLNEINNFINNENSNLKEQNQHLMKENQEAKNIIIKKEEETEECKQEIESVLTLIQFRQEFNHS
jgi:hypothetical protein